MCTRSKLLVCASAAGVMLAVVVSGAIGGRPAPAPSLLNGTVVTMNDRHDVIEDGHVLVQGGVIQAVWSGPTPPPGVSTAGARVVDAGAGGLIFPGLINLHDHPAYSVLPLWPAPASHQEPKMGRFTGREPYDYRYEWNSGAARPPEYKRLVRNAKSALADTDKLNLLPELLVHAEASAALGGETAIQGEDASSANGLIVRDAEGWNFGRDHIESRFASVDDPDGPWGDGKNYPTASELASAITGGAVDAWFVHLAEGVRDADREPGDFFSSRHEFATLAEDNLLTPATVIVHGTALERTDFERMSESGAKLVWSPLSNLLLYGRTTNVYDALAAGVTVSLGTDWTPSGSRTLLDELKVADIALRDQRVLGDFRSEVPAFGNDLELDRALVDMVTRNPAQTLKWPEVGSIAPGKHADLLLLSRPPDSPTGGMPDSPYRNLIDATERDVRLVLVNGRPVAGDLDALQAAGATDVTTLHSLTSGYTKGVAFRSGPPPQELRLAPVERTLSVALQALGGDGATPASGQPRTSDFTYLRDHWNNGSYQAWSNQRFFTWVLLPFAKTAGGLINLERIEKTPLLSQDDRFFFTIVEGRLTETGLPDDPAPPFHLYQANVNQARGGSNPLATFRQRWYS